MQFFWQPHIVVSIHNYPLKKVYQRHTTRNSNGLKYFSPLIMEFLRQPCRIKHRQCVVVPCYESKGTKNARLLFHHISSLHTYHFVVFFDEWWVSDSYIDASVNVEYYQAVGFIKIQQRKVYVCLESFHYFIFHYSHTSHLLYELLMCHYTILYPSVWQ